MKELGIAIFVLLELLTLEIIYGMIGREGLIFIGKEMIIANVVLLVFRWVGLCHTEPRHYLFVCIVFPPMVVLVMLIDSVFY